MPQDKTEYIKAIASKLTLPCVNTSFYLQVSYQAATSPCPALPLESMRNTDFH